MKYTFIASLLATLLLSACGGNKATNETADNEYNDLNPQNEIYSLRELSHSDSIRIGANLYLCNYRFYNVDSLATIQTYEGLVYKDNAVDITIEQQGQTISTKTLTKSSFRSCLPDEVYAKAGLVGFSYDYTMKDDNSAIYYLATLGDPDETSSFSYQLRIKLTPKCEIMSIEQVSLPDTEPMQEGMTVDPTVDAG